MASAEEAYGDDTAWAGGTGESLDVEDFKKRVGLDERCAKSLDELPPQSQQIVMTLVNQQTGGNACRNPSAVTFSKIRAMKERPEELKYEYVKSMLDERAGPALAGLHQSHQAAVLEMVDVTRCRNLSAVIWSKIRTLGLAGVAGGAPTQRSALPVMPTRAGSQPSMGFIASPPSAHTIAAVSAQAASLGLDEGAQEALGRLSLSEQSMVLTSVNPGACRNPSAVVIKKIQQMRQGVHLGANVGARDRSRTPPPHAFPALGQGPTERDNAISMAVVEALRAAPGAAQAVAQALGGPQFQTAMHPQMMGSQPTPMTGLDDRATQALHELPPDLAHMIHFLVSQENCKNPSAVAWTKVKRAKENPSEVKWEYLKRALDEGALKALMELPQQSREALMTDIDVTRVRNLSAVIWSKVKAFGDGASNNVPFVPHFKAEEHAAGGDLDHRAIEALGKIPFSQQQAILSQIPHDCKNRSAYVWSKVKILL